MKTVMKNRFLLVYSFLMYIFDRWSPYSYQNNREKYMDDDEKREFNMKECLWFCMTSLTPQGNLFPTSLPLPLHLPEHFLPSASLNLPIRPYLSHCPPYFSLSTKFTHISYHLLSRWRRSAKKSIRSFGSSNMVALRFHNHCILYS